MAHTLLERVMRDGAFAERLLAGAGRTPGLGPRDCGLLTELVYGCLRHRRWLDSVLQERLRKPLHKLAPKVYSALLLGAYQILCMRVPDHGAVHATVDLLPANQAPLRGLVNAVLRRLCALPPYSALPPPTGCDATALRLSLPRWLVDDVAAQRGAAGADGLAAALCWGTACLQAPPINLRINARRASLAAVRDSLTAAGFDASASPLAGDCNLQVVRGGAPEKLPGFAAGHFTVQDPAASYAVACLTLEDPPRQIVDLCAAPGGKTGHLAERFPNSPLLAVDVHPDRLRRLRDACNRLGHHHVATAAFDGCVVQPLQDLLRDRGGDGTADLVLLDAPCSGMGTLRRHVELRQRAVAPQQGDLLGLQRRLLDAAADLLAPHGSLLYCVCSPLRAEGAAQIAAFLQRHPDFSVRHQRQLWTDLDGCDSFFLAQLQRAASPP